MAVKLSKDAELAAEEKSFGTGLSAKIEMVLPQGRIEIAARTMIADRAIKCAVDQLFLGI
jgi:hypothetical protein